MFIMEMIFIHDIFVFTQIEHGIPFECFYQ